MLLRRCWSEAADPAMVIKPGPAFWVHLHRPKRFERGETVSPTYEKLLDMGVFEFVEIVSTLAEAEMDEA